MKEEGGRRKKEGERRKRGDIKERRMQGMKVKPNNQTHYKNYYIELIPSSPSSSSSSLLFSPLSPSLLPGTQRGSRPSYSTRLSY